MCESVLDNSDRCIAQRTHLEREKDGEPAQHAVRMTSTIGVDGQEDVSEKMCLEETCQSVADALSGDVERVCGGADVVSIGEGESVVTACHSRRRRMVEGPAALHSRHVFSAALSGNIGHSFQIHHVGCLGGFGLLFDGRQTMSESWVSAVHFGKQLRCRDGCDVGCVRLGNAYSVGCLCVSC